MNTAHCSGVRCLVDHTNGLEAFESVTTGTCQALTGEPPLPPEGGVASVKV
jgi:hypothetical protein